MSISTKDKVLVEITGTRGSTPRGEDAWMIVGTDEVIGTIGGGQLEYMAIDAARSGRRGPMPVPLGPGIGQCCGGHVDLMLTAIGDAEVARRLAASSGARPKVLIFGAGHTGRALFDIVRALPLDAMLIDSRADELAKANGPTVLAAIPEAHVTEAPPGSAFVVLTHDHALDFLVAGAALERGDAVYVGLIGSATKRTRFERWCRAQSPAIDPNQLVCPIGRAAPRDKRPGVIAAFTATEILTCLAARAALPEPVS